MTDATGKSEQLVSNEIKAPTQSEFHFIRNPMFRTVYADGVWFNPDINGIMRMTFFNSHVPIPDKVIVNVNSEGIAVSNHSQESKEGTVRELEVDIVMTLAATVEFYQLLGNNIKNLTAAIKKTIPENMQEAMKGVMKQ